MGKEVQFTEEQYDEMAAATGWQGPLIAYDLVSSNLVPGQRILDIGIGTGLSSKRFYEQGIQITGLDIDSKMLEACRKKGYASELICHDLNDIPYPFEDSSFDHVVSTGVFQFFEVLEAIFGEVYRIMKNGGMFVFITGDLLSGNPDKIVVDPIHSGMDSPVTMYLHSIEKITSWLNKNSFLLMKHCESFVYMDITRKNKLPLRIYLAVKTGT